MAQKAWTAAEFKKLSPAEQDAVFQASIVSDLSEVPPEFLDRVRSRAHIIRQALERYLEDYDDLEMALERLRDPTDPVLDWDQVRHELLDSD
ncbi:MAG: hypothetical protein OXG67_03595 [bacterium]|nr:hypothetical protein [bacterium]